MIGNPIERLKRLGLATTVAVAVFGGVLATSATAYVVYNYYTQDAYNWGCHARC